MNVGYRCPDPEAWRKFEAEYIEQYPEPFAKLHENLNKIDLEEQAFLKKMQESDLPKEEENTYFQDFKEVMSDFCSMIILLFTPEPEYTSDLRLLSKPELIALIKRHDEILIESMPPHRRELFQPLRIIGTWQGPCEFIQMIFAKYVYAPWLFVRDTYHIGDPEEQRLNEEFHAQIRLRRPNFNIHLNQ